MFVSLKIFFIDIKGKCTIFNYDPRETQPDNNGYITVNVENDYCVLQKGLFSFNTDSNSVDLNVKKYSIFKALAGYDQTKKDVSLEDEYNNEASEKDLFGEL